MKRVLPHTLIEYYRHDWRKLIPSCNSKRMSEVRKVCHRTDTFRIRSKVFDLDTQSMNQAADRRKGHVGENLLAQVFPDMLRRIEVGTPGRWQQQTNIFRDGQALGSVPDGPVQQHGNEVAPELLGHMGQEHSDHLRIRSGQAQRRQRGSGKGRMCKFEG